MPMWLTVGMSVVGGTFGNMATVGLVLAAANQQQNKPRPPRGKYIPRPVPMGA